MPPSPHWCAVRPVFRRPVPALQDLLVERGASPGTRWEGRPRAPGVWGSLPVRFDFGGKVIRELVGLVTPARAGLGSGASRAMRCAP